MWFNKLREEELLRRNRTTLISDFQPKLEAVGRDPPETPADLSWEEPEQWTERRWNLAGHHQALARMSLVCLHWAQRCRIVLWKGRELTISSSEKAKWFKWLATTHSSTRLTLIVSLIGRVKVEESLRSQQSWHHLCFSSTRDKLESPKCK